MKHNSHYFSTNIFNYSAQVSFSYTITVKLPPVYLLLYHPWAAEHIWGKTPKPLASMLHKINGLQAQQCWWCYSVFMVCIPSSSPPFPSPSYSTGSSVLAQVWIYSSWSSCLPFLAGTSSPYCILSALHPQTPLLYCFLLIDAWIYYLHCLDVLGLECSSYSQHNI